MKKQKTSHFFQNEKKVESSSMNIMENKPKKYKPTENCL